MRRSLKWLALGAVLVGSALGLWRHLDHEMDRASSAGEPIHLEVLQGEPLRGVLARLQQQGAVRHAREVEWYLRLHRLHPRVQAGNYEIAPHASARAVLDQLVAGRVLLEQLTVVEGWRFADLRRALDAHSALAHTLRGQSDEALMNALGHAGEAAEGRFFPDTYRFAAGTPDRRILELAYERMQHALQEAWDARAADLPLAGPSDALILASIVEKETGREEERAMVAAVFVNRLRRGMRLQSDPTVIYGLGDRYDGNIHTRDLETDTPYNSYTRAGLPPTPIALPGNASLEATLHPAATDVLYFVATGNGDGSHQFSSTLEQHDVALRAYLRRIGVSTHRSSPP
ncbi:MAG TPA: endolytic transglycosylase MltG [Steroidobacteraceae bacterium]|nr:endolytic transglycosylase MltG [Steroidobacteraceae bacterium]